MEYIQQEKKGRNEWNCIRRQKRKTYKEKQKEINAVEAGKYDGITKKMEREKEKNNKLRISKQKFH